MLISFMKNAYILNIIRVTNFWPFFHIILYFQLILYNGKDWALLTKTEAHGLCGLITPFSLLVTKSCAPWAGCWIFSWFVVSAELCLAFPFITGMPEAFFYSKMSRAHCTLLFQKAQL